MGNIKPTQEQIIRWSEEFKNDGVLAIFYMQFTKVFELAIPTYIISKKDGNIVATSTYDSDTLNLLKIIEREKNDYINSKYKHLIDEGFLTVSTNNFDQNSICISGFIGTLSGLAPSSMKP